MNPTSNPETASESIARRREPFSKGHLTLTPTPYDMRAVPFLSTFLAATLLIARVQAQGPGTIVLCMNNNPDIFYLLSSCCSQVAGTIQTEGVPGSDTINAACFGSLDFQPCVAASMPQLCLITADETKAVAVSDSCGFTLSPGDDSFLSASCGSDGRVIIGDEPTTTASEIISDTYTETTSETTSDTTSETTVDTTETTSSDPPGETSATDRSDPVTTGGGGGTTSRAQATAGGSAATSTPRSTTTPASGGSGNNSAALSSYGGYTWAGMAATILCAMVVLA